MTVQAAPQHRVVVGIDGFVGSRHALAWAATYARRSGATLVPVHVYDPRARLLLPAFSPSLAARGDEQHHLVQRGRIADALHAEAVHVLRDMLRETAGLLVGLRVEPAAVPGTDVARTLLDQVGPGDLLVVGRRGHGGFFLGSVSTTCAHHARGPVVVVPAP